MFCVLTIQVINDGFGNGLGATAAVPRPTAMEIVTPADGRRTLWCELSEVVSSGILSEYPALPLVY